MHGRYSPLARALGEGLGVVTTNCSTRSIAPSKITGKPGSVLDTIDNVSIKTLASAAYSESKVIVDFL